MRLNLQDPTCPFCGTYPEARGTAYLRCPDVECAGHHWTTARKWNRRAVSNVERALQNVMEARETWVQNGDPAALSVTLLLLKRLICPDPEQPVPPEPEITDEPVPIYGCPIVDPRNQ